MEIEQTKVNAKNLKIQIDKTVDESENDDIDRFVEHLKSPVSYFPKSVNSIDDIIELWKDYWPQISPGIEKKLRNMFEGLLDELKQISKKRMDDLNFHKFVEAVRSDDEATRLIKYNRAAEEQRKFDELKSKIDHEQRRRENLEALVRYDELEYDSLVFPKHLKFGFLSFLTFAILGVLIPLTNKWWSSLVKGYLDPDLFAFVMFVIGLGITFVYIRSETVSILIQKNN